MASRTPTQIEVPEIGIRRLQLTIKGNAPLVSHAWSAKAVKMIADAQSGKPKQGKKNREGRDPEQEFRDSMYYTKDGRPGLPARILKATAVAAANDVGIFQTQARRMFHVEGDILPIVGSEPEMRTDMVRLESGVASIAYRAMFREWQVTFWVRYNNGIISAAHIVNLFRTAGFGCGLMEGRPNSKKGTGMGWGTFDVEDVVNTEDYEREAAPETVVDVAPQAKHPARVKNGKVTDGDELR